MSATFYCDRCEAHKATPEGVGTGYAVDPSTGQHLCYECADELALATMSVAKQGARVTHYISSDGAKLTTWTGGYLGDVIHWGNQHPWSDERHYIRVRARDGRLWAGTGAPGMYATLRLIIS